MSLPGILSKVKDYVKSWYSAQVPQWRTFHNLDHTSQVVSKCRQLASYYALEEVEYFALLAAAWFHDAGFSSGDLDHEMASANIAVAFLSAQNIDKYIVAMVRQLILATKLPSKPESLTQEILCDCDLHHIGFQNYPTWSSRLKNEVEHQKGIQLSDERWKIANIEFFESHVFYTDFARARWGLQKEKNLSLLREIQVR